MDITGIKSAISNVQSEVKKTIDAEIAAQQFNALKGLAGINNLMAKALERADGAHKRSQPRAKKDKKPAKK